MKVNEQRIPLGENFGKDLGKILKDYNLTSRQISKDIGKNRTYVSHITLGKIKQLPFSVINDLIRAISERAIENLSPEEAEKTKKIVCFKIKEMLPGSLTNITYETLLFKRRPFYNKDFIVGIIQDLENINYSPTEFIVNIVNPKGSLEILGYKKKPELFEYTYNENYLTNLLLDPTEEHYQSTNYKEMFVLVYRFFELWQSIDKESFKITITDLLPDSKFFSKLSDEMFIKEATYAMLFQVEYYTFDELLDDFNEDPKMHQLAEARSSMIEVLSAEEKKKIQVLSEIEHSLDTLASFFDNPEFINLVNNNLNHSSFHFIYEIFKKDYTKIHGRDNEFGFLKELQQIYIKWADK